MTNLTPDELGALADLARDEAGSGHPFLAFADDPDHVPLADIRSCGACGGWHPPGELCDLDDIVDTAGEGEGWGIYDSCGSSNGPWQIQRHDEPTDHPGEPHWASDTDVWEWLYFRAIHGDPTVWRVMAFLRTENPHEYRAIVRHCITGEKP